MNPTTIPIKIARYNIANKRRMVIYLDELANHSGIPYSTLNQTLQKSSLRQKQDWEYSPKKKDFALSLSSAQAVILLAEPTAWHTWHAITDIIQGI